MKVYKFGGASVKNVEGVKNLCKILQQQNNIPLVVVLSAMGKTTNHLEAVVTAYLNKDSSFSEKWEYVKAFHKEMLQALFTPTDPVHETINQHFKETQRFFKTNKSTQHAFVYDQVVSLGEILSTTIVSAYLNNQGVTNTWLDVRSCIKTDAYFREAVVNWDTTNKAIKQNVALNTITLTQGFLGADQTNNFTTTLGREGSDYTAAIFAYCLQAETVTIWKDVPGVLNADPNVFKQTTLLKQISYQEAIELAFYGASVIHPKTLQPLQRKEIPLFVKSFDAPEAPGTCVAKGNTIVPYTACYIQKKAQLLLCMSSLDFSFMMETHFRDIFALLSTYKMKVTLIHNSAISFSVCVTNTYNTLPELLQKLKEKCRVTCYEGVTLYTIRHASSAQVKQLIKGRKVLLRQEIEDTVQLVIQP